MTETIAPTNPNYWKNRHRAERKKTKSARAQLEKANARIADLEEKVATVAILADRIRRPLAVPPPVRTREDFHDFIHDVLNRIGLEFASAVTPDQFHIQRISKEEFDIRFAKGKNNV